MRGNGGTPESGAGDAHRLTLSEALAAPAPQDRIDKLVRFIGEQFGGVVTTSKSVEARLTVVEDQVMHLMSEIERLRISTLGRHVLRPPPAHDEEARR